MQLCITSFAQCYKSVNVISLSLSKSDQIKRVYCKLFDWNFKLVQLLSIVLFEKTQPKETLGQ